MAERTRVVILGAAGRDFHNFNTVYRDDPATEVVAFTATQIMGIAGRRYPPSLAGPLYPEGIPILDESELDALLARTPVDQVVFAYSDVTHAHVMHLASRALAGGADFLLLGPQRTMLDAARPVIAISAVRTGCGKSQTSRYLSRLLRSWGLRLAILRHPMPYGDLERQAVQRFASHADLDAAACTVEEREEYEPHIAVGNTVWAGVDYGRIVAQACQEADLLLWEGGNNDFPFLRPDLHIVLTDPLRAGHELTHHPGETVLRMADIVVLAKCDAAAQAQIQQVTDNVRRINPRAALLRAASPITLAEAATIRGRRVAVVEDGPSVTHGGMAYGAGYVAASRAGAQIIDPRPYAAPTIAEIYAAYPHIGPVLPAMGYTAAQLEALSATLAAMPVDCVLAATPADLARLVQIDKPVLRAHYDYAELDSPGLADHVRDFLAARGLLTAYA
ncbi:MAG: cyclic 2,3-diphosphoglycerate synthase [Thiobacillaceae bacterium]